ncbi:histone H2A-Bbd type 1-like [Arvicola amphibius]|uniref:histone H2A-Bbd type 1-like n=1 Tax=Arvicola amphibius TaxID=1047088 RepID=UPI0018E2C8ED|nr:histone H2A-Bbd type 1-like [Arvicola amphibius]
MAVRRPRGNISCKGNTSRRHNISRRCNTSRCTRAELQFPVSRVDHYLREGRYSRRLSSSAPVFLARVLEYLTSNILDLAGEEAHTNGRKRITLEHVYQVVENNEQLHELFGDPRSLGEETSELNEN